MIITSGKIGKAALSDETKKIVEDALNNKNYNDVYYDIPTYDKYPEKIDVEKIHSTGQPVLIGTASIEQSEQLSAILSKKGIPHNVLNAKFH